MLATQILDRGNLRFVAKRKRLALLCCLGALIGCTADPPSVDPPLDNPSAQAMTGNDILLLASAKVALPPSGLAPADLPDPESSGAQQLATFCVTCHALSSPLAHSATDWPRVLRRMWLRVGMLDSSFGVPVPNTAQRLVMLRYVEQNALQVLAGDLPDLAGRELFTTTCSQCHELPDPYQHSSEDWPVVVRRMMTHMEDILGVSITSLQYSNLSSFLSEVSSRGR